MSAPGKGSSPVKEKQKTKTKTIFLKMTIQIPKQIKGLFLNIVYDQCDYSQRLRAKTKWQIQAKNYKEKTKQRYNTSFNQRK